MSDKTGTEDIRTTVRSRYERAAEGSSCCGSGSSCCGGSAAAERSVQLGYSPEELATIPQEAVLGLGCGSPTAIASLEEGEVVVDLGSGGGIDCFIAARKVGPTGHVIGVDMTPKMIDRARSAASSADFPNVEFRLGEIEHLPIADGSVDAVLSNCVINLSPDKPQVFREVFRILKPGGRLMVSDIVTLGDLPPSVKRSAELYAGCIAGAMTRQAYLAAIEEAGFASVRVVSQSQKLGLSVEQAEELGLDAEQVAMANDLVVSVNVFAEKPGPETTPRDL